MLSKNRAKFFSKGRQALFMIKKEEITAKSRRVNGD
jgi:hypothetical protein